MSILTANLKHLYQRRGLWLVYVFLGFFAFLSIMAALDRPAAGKGNFVPLVMLAFLTGSIATASVIEVMTKPFSYCLPGHRKTVRKFIFWPGVVINLLWSFIFLMHPGFDSWQMIMVVCSAFSAGLIFYWLGAGLAFVIRNQTAAMGFLFWPIFGAIFFDLHIILERVIIQFPAIVVFVGILSSIVAWFWVGNPALARRYCDVPWMGFFDAWNRDKLQRYKQLTKLAKLKTHPNPWVERLFLAHMEKYDYFSKGKYIWGGLYTTFAVAMSGWKGNLSGLFVFLLVLCFLCYMGHAVTFTLFFLPGIMVAHARLPVCSSMLVSGGRNERFFTAMTLVAAIAVLITAVATIIAALSVVLSAIMPDITLRGSAFTFHAASIKPFFVPLLMIPIVFTIQLVFLKKPYFVMVTIILLSMLLFTGRFWLKPLGAMMNPIYLVVSLLVLSWSIFVLVLHHICMKRCLVGQGRTH